MLIAIMDTKLMLRSFSYQLMKLNFAAVKINEAEGLKDKVCGS